MKHFFKNVPMEPRRRVHRLVVSKQSNEENLHNKFSSSLISQPISAVKNSSVKFRQNNALSIRWGPGCDYYIISMYTLRN